MRGFGKLWEALVCFRMLLKDLEGFGRLWEILGCFERFWDALAAKMKIFKASDALEGFGGFRNALGGFGKH